jgi:hypothetical protein
MATNFPTSVDSLVNPVSNDSLNSPSHSAQHANANDAIEAIEGYLLTGLGKSGFVHLQTSSVTSAATITFANVYSASFPSYLITLSGLNSVANGQIAYRNAISGTPSSSSDWNGIEVYSNNATAPSNYAGGLSDRVHASDGGTGSTTGLIYVFYPFQERQTRLQSSSVGFSSSGSFATLIANGAFQNNSVSYNGFVLSHNTGNFTGDISVYGIRS